MITLGLSPEALKQQEVEPIQVIKRVKSTRLGSILKFHQMVFSPQTFLIFS